MSDPYIGSQPGRQNLGIPGFSRLAGTKPQDPAQETAPAPFTPPRPEADAAGTKQRLTTFLSKLETTWQLFNRGTRETDEGALPKGKTAYLDDSELPTPASLKELRARSSGSGAYLAKGQSGSGGGGAVGPKDSPLPDQGSSKSTAKTGRAGKPEETAPSRAKSPGLSGGSAGGADKSAAPQRPAAWQPAGLASSRSFLATATMAGAQMRNSDASGKPGNPAQMEMLARQPVFSQNLAQVNPRVTSRQVSAHMPIHSPFLDEHHDNEAEPASPLKLLWSGGPKQPVKSEQNRLGGESRLRFPAHGKAEGASGNGQAVGAHLSLHTSAAMNAARSDIAARFAGKAIHSLLKKLYDEEDVEELDEEKAVNGLGLILRLGGEFTYEHSTRVLDLALELADEVGIQDQATRKEIEYGAALCDIGEFDLLLQSGQGAADSLGEFLGGQDMLRAGLLHDIGKVNIPPEILYKPGKLTPEEYEIMKLHPIYGEEIVRPIASLRYLCPTIRGHHERWDGKGYPDGLAGEAIPIAARIISVADVFDALSAERPYKRGMEVLKVREILAEGRGTHFDPALVDSFLAIISRRYPGEMDDGSSLAPVEPAP